LLDNSGVAWVRRSAWNSIPDRSSNPGAAPKPLRPGEIILLDTIGELASVYSLASVAFVGGSLFPTGGHNPLEPAQFGVPIVVGPNYANFRAITEDLIAHDALRIATKEDLSATLIELLRDSAAATGMGARAQQFFNQQAGATARCVEALRELLAPITASERRA
jgi:3-deoxy-D-manno-octulosonic-acid transferase